MNVGEWRDAILLVLGFLLSIGAGLVGASIQRRLDLRSERRPLNSLLNFGPDSLLFIFPHRDTSPEAILPLTSTEDFLAMNNFISALMNAGWTRKIGVRDMHRVTESDKRRNLVIICSPKSNTIAAMFQKELRRLYPHTFAFGTDHDRVFINDAEDARYHSRTYEQVAEYLRQGIHRSDLPGQRYEDYGVVTKVANPWNEANKVVWVAGIRGIGTWGVAECIKKGWRQIYDRLPEDRKDSDFSALLKVQYDNCDVTSVGLCRLELLDTKKA
jgi:hypothetical protein